MTRTTTWPKWAPAFHALIDRLTARQHMDIRSELFGGREGAADTEEEKTPTPKERTDAPASLPTEAARPFFLHALAALHLARTFQPLQQLYAPRALTLFSSPFLLTSHLAWAVEKGVLPPSISAITASVTRSGRSGLMIVHPTSDSAASQRTFIETLRTALFEDQPCLIFLPKEISLPSDLATLLPPPVTPPAFDRPALCELLKAMFPSADADSHYWALKALPKYVNLDTLSIEGLALAFRSATPKEVITALVEHVGRVQKGQPQPKASVTFDQFDPEQEAVKVVRQTASDLSAWRTGQLPWSDIPNGLLLYGPPGTGKTLLARALAAEAGVPLIEATFSEWQQNATLGPMLERMHASFSDAYRAAPSIFFLDEIDAIGTRVERSHNSSYSDQVIAAFLVAVTRLREAEGVILIGATNRVEGLDPAILRPGRFDRKLELGLPSRAGIRAILARLLSEAPISVEARERLSRKALGRSPAEIDSALRQARAACRGAGKCLSEEEIVSALNNGSSTTPELSRRIALHEAGHALFGIRLGMDIVRITVGPREGMVMWTPRPHEGLASDFNDRIALRMAGRAAEELLLNRPSAGAGGPSSSDLAQATRLAADLELRYGLGSSGLMWWGVPSDVLITHPDFRRRVDLHLQSGLNQAKAVIRQMPHLVEALAEAVLRDGELSGPALSAWVETIRNFDPNIRNEPCAPVAAIVGPCKPVIGKEDPKEPLSSA